MARESEHIVKQAAVVFLLSRSPLSVHYFTIFLLDQPWRKPWEKGEQIPNFDGEHDEQAMGTMGAR